ncbi:NACHT, LRR and PYD domains-containing protein 3-like [Heterodontus francisci]|uniref:NACHT, LRR and PYD domains-containing protein 3-like n=1 Tax=Heterodontus francisci TaxID=7792 RepID=UPI00355B892C
MAVNLSNLCRLYPIVLTTLSQCFYIARFLISLQGKSTEKPFVTVYSQDLTLLLQVSFLKLDMFAHYLDILPTLCRFLSVPTSIRQRKFLIKLNVFMIKAERRHKEALLEETEWLRVHAGFGEGKLQSVALREGYAPVIAVAMAPGEQRGGHELMAKWRVQEELCQALREGRLGRVDLALFLASGRGPGVSRGRRVALAGVAGAGKTTAVQKLAQDWAAGTIYPQFRFLFPFRFRDLNSSLGGRTTLKALTAEGWPYLAEVLDSLWEQAEGLLVILDGLDEFEAPLELEGKAPEEADEEGEIPGIVGGLLRGTMLPGCTVLITGRPSALEALRSGDEARAVDAWAEILGFSASGRKGYLERLLGSAGLASDALRYLGEHPLLSAMGQEPLTCQVAAVSLGPCLAPQGGKSLPPPKTLTQLLVNYLLQVLRGCGREVSSSRDLLLKLGKLALEALSKGTPLLSKEQLAAHRLRASQFTHGCLAEILSRDEARWGRPGKGGGAYAFLHPTVQDFLAALAQYLDPPGDSLPGLLSQARRQADGRYRLFLHFVAGLSAPGAAWPLEEPLGHLAARTAAQASAWLQAEVLERGAAGGVGQGDGAAGEGRSLVEALCDLLEARRKKLVQGSLGSLEALRLGRGEARWAASLTSMDCAALCPLIHFCEALEELDLENCRLTGEGLARLVPALHRCRILRLKGVILRDGGAKMLAKALKKPKCRLQTVVMVSSGLTEACVGDLSSALLVNESLRNLQLGDNGLGDTGLKRLCMALRDPVCKLQKLGVDRNGLTKACAEDLAFALGGSCSLTELDLSENRLGDAGFIVLSTVLQSPGCGLQALALASNKLSDACAWELSAILSQSKSLLTINLNSNNLGDLGIKYLCTGLRSPDCRIQKLG